MRAIDSKIPTSYGEASALLGTRISRALGGNTELRYRLTGEKGSSIEVRLYSTAAVTFYFNGEIELNSGGFRTVTTKARINAAIAKTGFKVIQRDGEWILSTGRQAECRFFDGIRVKAAGQGCTAEVSLNGGR